METETLISSDGTAVTEYVPAAELARYRSRQRNAGRFITSSVMAGAGGYYVTTVADHR